MDMYPAIINSPETTLSRDITDLSSEIVVEDGNKLPPAPNLATIGYDTAEAETVLYGTKVGNTLTEVVRGFQGQARPWNSGAVISRMFTAYDHDTFLQSIRAVENDVDSIEDSIDELQIPTSARIIVGTSASGWTAKDCHYLCDGTADDVEINNAITALPATGGEIIILDGTYNITTKINVNKDNVSIVGNGKSTCLSKKWNDTDGTITVTSKYCSIRNIYFYGNDSQPFATNAGIYLSVGADSSIINNNWFENFECGVHVFSSHNSISSNVCHVLPIEGYGILLKSSSDNAIINNVCNGGNSGIYLSSSNNNTITGNTCNNNRYGIYLASSSNNTVTGNTCNNNSYGIYLASSSNNTVTGNTCIRGIGTPEDYTTAQHTILLSGTSNNYNLISSNNCMGKAVVVGGGTGNSVFNNKYDESSDFEEHLSDFEEHLSDFEEHLSDFEEHLFDVGTHIKPARFVIGTSEAGWTAKDCDYLCDGTDDQAEIIAALAALPSAGGEIVILDGTYNITASINIPKDNVSIRGSGNATTLKRMYNSTNTDSGPTARGLITLNEKSGCKIQGLQIDGDKATYTASYNYGISLFSSSNNTVTGNTCNNNNCGIYLRSSSNNTITGNTCNNNNEWGIYLESSSNENIITGNTCNNNSYGIRLYSSSNNTIISNTYNNNNNNGIYLYSSSNENTVTGNTCNNNSYGIRLNASSNNTVTGNTYNNNSYGIRLYSSSNENTITGNTCNNNSYNGIYLGSSSNNTVTGNTCNNNNDNGIFLESSSNENTITGNTCIRGTGQTSDYTANQHTILLSGTANNYNLISSNNCMGKAVVISGGTGNSAWGNKYDSDDNLVDLTSLMPKSGGFFTGMVVAQNNTSYTTKQLRNIYLSTANPSGGSNGDIWIKYE